MQKTSPPILFDPVRLRAVTERAVRIGMRDADFLVREAARTIAGRLEATNRNFETAVDLFSMSGAMKVLLEKSAKTTNIHTLNDRPSRASGLTPSGTMQAVSANRDRLALKPQSTNLVTSVFGLHWCNDLPGMLTQINMALVPDGLFMAALPGDRTLHELRECLLEAESNLSGTASLRIDPFGEVRQFGSLLQRAGFALPVVDTDLVTVRYKCLADLIGDLRAMGVTSTLKRRPGFGPRNLFAETEKTYLQKFQDEDGKIRATFEIVYLSGWSPHDSQQKPLKPGSAKHALKDFL